MAYDTNVLRRASQRLEEDRRRREEELQVRQTDAYRRLPRLRELDRRIQRTMSGRLQFPDACFVLSVLVV